MKIATLAGLLGLGLAGCTYHSGTETRTDIGASTPATPSAAPAPTDGKNLGQSKPDPRPATRPGDIKGVGLFDRQATVVTVVCSSHTYDIKYSARAAAALAPKPGNASVAEISRVDVSLRCHPKGFANFESRCYATTEVSMVLASPAGVRSATTTVAKGEGDAGAGALCEGGADAVTHSMDAALSDASRILAGGR